MTRGVNVPSGGWNKDSPERDSPPPTPISNAAPTKEAILSFEKNLYLREAFSRSTSWIFSFTVHKYDDTTMLPNLYDFGNAEMMCYTMVPDPDRLNCLKIFGFIQFYTTQSLKWISKMFQMKIIQIRFYNENMGSQKTLVDRLRKLNPHDFFMFKDCSSRPQQEDTLALIPKSRPEFNTPVERLLQRQLTRHANQWQKVREEEVRIYGRALTTAEKNDPELVRDRLGLPRYEKSARSDKGKTHREHKPHSNKGKPHKPHKPRSDAGKPRKESFRAKQELRLYGKVLTPEERKNDRLKKKLYAFNKEKFHRNWVTFFERAYAGPKIPNAEILIGKPEFDDQGNEIIPERDWMEACEAVMEAEYEEELALQKSLGMDYSTEDLEKEFQDAIAKCEVPDFTPFIAMLEK